MIQRITGLESEQVLDAAPKARRERTMIVETADFVVVQACNGHLQVYEKESGDMVFHLNKPSLFTREELEAFAEQFQNLTEDNVQELIDFLVRTAE